MFSNHNTLKSAELIPNNNNNNNYYYYYYTRLTASFSEQNA